MPAASAACNTVEPGGTSTSIPSMVSFGMGLLRRQPRDGTRLIGRDPFLHHGTEVPDQALHRPGGGIAEGADRMTFDLPRDLVQSVDFRRLGAAFDHAGHDAPQPAGTLTARCA